MPALEIKSGHAYLKRKQVLCNHPWNCFLSNLEKSDLVEMELYTAYPTDRFTIFYPQNPSHDVPELHKKHRSPDCEALNLRKDRSGREQKKQQFVYFVFFGNLSNDEG